MGYLILTDGNGNQYYHDVNGKRRYIGMVSFTDTKVSEKNEEKKK